jgi:hypothetical protein
MGIDELLDCQTASSWMSEGRIVDETPTEAADVRTIGTHLAGHH